MMRIAHLIDGRTKTGAISSVRRIMANYHYDDSELILLAYGNPLPESDSHGFKSGFIDLKFPKNLSEFVVSPAKHIHFLPVLLVTFFTDLTKLRNYCRSNNIDCLHLHHFADIFQFGFLSSRKLKIVSHIRAIVNKSLWKGIPYKLFRYYSYRNSDRIIGISHASLDALNYPDNSKTKIIYNGLEGLAQTENNSISDKIGSSFIVGSVIRFAKLKGIYLYFDTFFSYFKNYTESDVKFLLIAPAKDDEAKRLRKYFFDKVKKSGLESRLIYFEHFPDYSYIMPYINLLFHTTLQREGFGNVVLEAAWFGKPAISTPCKGVNDIIESGQSGFIMDGYTATESCELIHKLVENGSEYQHFSNRAFEIAHSGKFSIAETTKQLHELYISLR